MSMLFGVSAFAADIDVTNKVGTSLDAWTCENGKKASVTIDGIAMVENFQDGQTSTSAETTGVVLWQDVAGLDNGNYTVELWANARVAWQDSPATDGQEELTYLVANNVEISMQVFLNPGLNNNATYVLEGVEVTDGTLHIEMNKKAAGSNWHSIQIKKLTYHASDDEALIAAKADLKAALDAAVAVAPASEALTAAIAVAQGVYDASTDIEEVKAAVAPLQAATAFAVNCNSVAGASVAAPVVTNFVVNGTFDTTTSPWKTTTKAQNQALASNQTGAFTGKFFENWNPSNYTGKIYQVIENIPNGLYELSICAFVNNFVAGANYVYANADKKELTTGAPTAYTVRTTVTDNVIEIGLEQVEAVNEWMGIDNVSLKYFGEVDENYAKDIYASTKAAAEALLAAKMSPEALATLEAALAVEVDETSDEALLAAEAALQEAIASVQASVNFYASNKAAIDAMFALMESTNVYTEEAYSTYAALAEEYLAKYEACELTATVDNPATVHGWHAEVAYDDLLLSAFGTNNFDTDLYINTWSIEGETDGSEFKVPFFEYWTGDANSLGATTKTATLTGLEAGKVYELSAWVRTRAKNGVAAAEATGITLNVGDGDTVDVTEGVVIGESQFAHAVYTAKGAADENGTLTINFNVLADNNVSWLSFKNLKYTEYNPAKDEFLAAYAQLELLTESCPSLWMIAACNEKFMAIQEPAYAMKEAINATPIDTLVKYTGILNETVAFIQAMDAKYNEWKGQLFVAYDYQDNSTADEAVAAAFAEVVDKHAGYQWMMPAATVAELDALIAELKDAALLYALCATANAGFDFGVAIESSWAGESLTPGSKYYIYNTASKTYLSQGNSWGTRASLDATGLEVVVTADSAIQMAHNSGWYLGDDLFVDNKTKKVYSFEEVTTSTGLSTYLIKKNGDYLCSTDASTEVVTSTGLSMACFWQLVTLEQRDAAALAALEGASVLAPADATFLVKGAEFNYGNAGNWSGSPKIDGARNPYVGTNGEKWNAGVVEVSQVLRGVPAGVYRLSAQGFYRMGDVKPAAEARAAGTEVLHAKFFANGDSIPVMSVMEEAGKVDGVGADYPGFGQAPNSQGEAAKFFNAGLYEHSFMFTLEEGVDTIKLGATKTGSVGNDWLLFDNFRLEYLGAKNNVDYFGNGTLASVSEGNHYVFYTDAEGGNHFLYAAGDNKWVVLDNPVTIAFSAGNITGGFAGAASFMNSNGFYMSNAANADGSGAIKTEAVDGKNGQSKRTWESQVFYKNAAGKYAIRLTNATGTNWGANCFVNIDPATFAVASGQPSLADALYLWEIADEDDPRFSTQVLVALIEEAEALTDAYNKDVKAALAAVVEKAKVATAAEVQAIKAELEAAIAAAKASIADYKAIAEQLAIVKTVLAETAVGYAEFAPVAAEVETAYNEATATVEVLPVLKAAIATYLAANEVEGIVNGTFGDASGASVAGWTQVGGEMGKTGNHNKWTNVNDGFFEQWKNTLPDMEFYQEVSGLPAGTYTFAAYVVACQQSNPDSHEVTGVNLFANAAATPIHTINVDRNVTNQAIGAELVLVTTTIAEGETLKVGLSVKSTDANWVVIDNAKLYCFDKPAEIEMLPVVGAKVGDVDIVEGVATVESISTIDVTFDRPVALAEGAGWATLADSYGPTNLKAEVLAENACVVRFTVSDEFNGEFTEAGEYILNIPEGFIVGAEDANFINAAIEAVITIEAAPATPLTVTSVTVGENVVEGFSVEAKPTDMIKVNFDGQFYFQGTPIIVDAEGNDASGDFMFANGLDVDGSNSYIFQGMKGGIYTITLPKASFLEMMQWKAPAEDIVLTVKIVTEGEGIDNIAVDADTVIYDLSGKRVQGNVKSLERGIYIVNGKKVFVK